MIRSTKGKANSLLKPSDLNLWFARFNSGHPDIADDLMRACMGSEISWEKMFIFAAIRSDAFRKLDRDLFGTDASGRSLDDQIIAGVMAWANVDDLKFLATKDDELLKFDALWASWLSWRNPVLALRAKGSDLPLPKPEEPPKEPKPLPGQWWVCSKCQFLNPEKSERCLKCLSVKTSPTPAPEPGKPAEPPKKQGESGLKPVLKVLVSLLGVASIAGLFLPGWVRSALLALKAILEAVINNL